jgi:hypothetical protein
MAWAKSVRPKKYLPDGKPSSIHELVAAIEHNRPMIWRGFKFMHPTVLRNWSLASLIGCVRGGFLEFATPNPLHPDNQPADAEFEEVDV